MECSTKANSGDVTLTGCVGWRDHHATRCQVLRDSHLAESNALIGPLRPQSPCLASERLPQAQVRSLDLRCERDL